MSALNLSQLRYHQILILTMKNSAKARLNLYDPNDRQFKCMIVNSDHLIAVITTGISEIELQQ